MLAVTGEGLVLRFGGAGENCAHAQAGAKQRTRLRAMNDFEEPGFGRLALTFEIGHLTADHAAYRSGRDCEFADHLRFSLRRRTELSQYAKGKGEQRITRKNRHRI